jgi:DNA polymerase-1
MKALGHERGYAETLFGRRRPLPELREKGPRKSFGERVAMNMPVQGTAADIIKLAMVRVWERLKDEMPEARLILQVHDELLIEAPEALAQRAGELLKGVMESVASLSVPLVAEVQTGKSWYETK